MKTGANWFNAYVQIKDSESKQFVFTDEIKPKLIVADTVEQATTAFIASADDKLRAQLAEGTARVGIQTLQVAFR